MSTTPKPTFTLEHIELATGSALDHIAESFGIHRHNGLINPSLSDDESLRARIIHRLNQAEAEQVIKDRFGHIRWESAIPSASNSAILNHLLREHSHRNLTRQDFNDLYLCHFKPVQSFIGQVTSEDMTAAQINLDEVMAHRMRLVKEQQERNAATEFGRFLVYVMGDVDPSVNLTASQVRLAEDLFIHAQNQGVKPWQF